MSPARSRSGGGAAGAAQAAPAPQRPARQSAQQPAQQGQAAPEVGTTAQGGAVPQKTGGQAPQRTAGARTRPSAGRLRGWGAAALAACTLTGAAALTATNVAGTDSASRYAADLNTAVSAASELPQTAQEARDRTDGAAEQFLQDSGQLASWIPDLAAGAPVEDTGSYGAINRGVTEYVASTVGGTGDAASADQQYRTAVVEPLEAMSNRAVNVSPLVSGLFGLVSLASVLISIAAAVVLARTTKRVLDIRVTVGIVLLLGTVLTTFSTLFGTFVWVPGVAGALLFTGGVVSGALIWSGVSKRAQEYR